MLGHVRDWAGPILLAAATLVLLIDGSRKPARVVDGQPRPTGNSAGPSPDAVLESRVRSALVRVEEKLAVATALLRGDMDLGRAADRFREISAGDPATLARLGLLHPGVSERELWHRNVICFARGLTAEHPTANAEGLARVEAEFVRLFGPRPPSATSACGGA
jgi:hypothetical protein